MLFELNKVRLGPRFIRRIEKELELEKKERTIETVSKKLQEKLAVVNCELDGIVREYLRTTPVKEDDADAWRAGLKETLARYYMI